MHTTTEPVTVPICPGRIAHQELWGRILAEYDDQGRLLCISHDGRHDPRDLDDLMERQRPDWLA